MALVVAHAAAHAQRPAIDTTRAVGNALFSLSNDATTPRYGAVGQTQSPVGSATIYFVRDSTARNCPGCRFEHLAGGSVDSNPYERDEWGGFAIEQRYDRDSVGAGAVIADRLMLDDVTMAWISNGPIVIELKGHRDESDVPQAHPDSTVLWIDLFVARSPLGSPANATQANGSRPCATLAIAGRDLFRPSPAQHYERYQSVILPFDAGDCFGIATSHVATDATSSAIMNIRLRFAGAATIALRSLSIHRQATPDK